MSVGEKIREARKQQGLSMAELGKRLGITAAAISRYELGQRQISIDTLRRIAAALNVNPFELYPEDERADAIVAHLRWKLRDGGFPPDELSDALSEIPEEYHGALIAANTIKRAGLTVKDTDTPSNSTLSTLEELQKGGSKWRKLTPVEAYQMGFPGFNSELDRIKWIYDFLLNNSGKASVFFFLVANLNEEQVRLTLDYLEKLIRIPHFQKSSEQKKEPSGEGNP